MSRVFGAIVHSGPTDSPIAQAIARTFRPAHLDKLLAIREKEIDNAHERAVEQRRSHP